VKVLHVVEATTAGVGRHVFDLATAMHQGGVAVMVVCPPKRQGAQKDTGFADRLQAAGVPVSRLPMRRSVSPIADLRALAQLVRLLQGANPDVVHAHSTKAGVLARVAVRLAGLRPNTVSIYTPNAFAFLDSHSQLLRWCVLQVERWLGRRATDLVIAVSRSEWQVAREKLMVPAGRLTVVENAVDAAEFGQLEPAGVARDRLGLDPDRLTVGFVGRLVRQKGLGTLLLAARRVMDAGLAVQWLLVGEGPEESALRRTAAGLNLSEHVVFAGYRSDIPTALAAMDLVILPSWYEGLPYTLLEAMAAGRAVVASDVVGNRDLVRDGVDGVLVPPGDAAALALAMQTILVDSAQRHRLGQAARASALARPTPAETAGQVLELYRRTMESALRADGP